MAVPDSLLSRRGFVDGLERDADFDQLPFRRRHAGRPWQSSCWIGGRKSWSTRLRSFSPGLGPVESDIGGGEVAEVDAAEVLGDVAELVVFGAFWADFDHDQAVCGGDVLAE